MNAATPTLTLATAAAYVETVAVPGYTFKAHSACQVVGSEALVETTGTDTETGHTFPAQWAVWVEPERGDPSGLYGEW